jgi:hypothetical protein
MTSSCILTIIIVYAINTHYISFFLQVPFTRKNFGKEERELKWAHAERTLHGLQLHVCNCWKHLNGIFVGLHVFTNIQAGDFFPSSSLLTFLPAL